MNWYCFFFDVRSRDVLRHYESVNPGRNQLSSLHAKNWFMTCNRLASHELRAHNWHKLYMTTCSFLFVKIYGGLLCQFLQSKYTAFCQYRPTKIQETYDFIHGTESPSTKGLHKSKRCKPSALTPSTK
jgi:hypothetical protein